MMLAYQRNFYLLFLFFIFLCGQTLSAQESSSATGRGAASEYFKDRNRGESEVDNSTASSGSHSESRQVATVGVAPRYLSLHIGGFFEQETYKWGDQGSDDAGKLTAGVSYRVGEWTNSMDLLFRADFISYELKEDRAVKMSLLPMITFPDASSAFPLYFGGGVGLGIFFKQIDDESSISLDYQLVAGARFFNVFDELGLMVEMGMKNHVLLLSDGQYNGVFASGGAVFAF